MKHELIKLPYDYTALEPHMDAQTVEIHHSKHHQTYVNKLNEALDKHPELFEKSLEDLLKNLNEMPEDIKTAVQNHGGGTYNHNLFWTILAPSEQAKKAPEGKLLEKINEDFGSFENFKKEFETSATGHFASGWTWLVLDQVKNLKIYSTKNHDCPLSQGHIPLMVIDVWEHAYYLKFQNRRNEFVPNFWNILDWNRVEERFA